MEILDRINDIGAFLILMYKFWHLKFFFLFCFICSHIPNSISLNSASAKRKLKILSTWKFEKKAFVLLDLLDHLLFFFLLGGVTNIFTFCVNCGNFCFLFLFICGYIPNSILLMNYASAKRELKFFSTRAFVLIGLLKHFLLF